MIEEQIREEKERFETLSGLEQVQKLIEAYENDTLPDGAFMEACLNANQQYVRIIEKKYVIVPLLYDTEVGKISWKNPAEGGLCVADLMNCVAILVVDRDAFAKAFFDEESWTGRLFDKEKNERINRILEDYRSHLADDIWEYCAYEDGNLVFVNGDFFGDLDSAMFKIKEDIVDQPCLKDFRTGRVTFEINE